MARPIKIEGQKHLQDKMRQIDDKAKGKYPCLLEEARQRMCAQRTKNMKRHPIGGKGL